MAKLRVHRANGESIYDMMGEKKKEGMKEKRVLNLDKRVVQKKLEASINETIGNITV